MLTLFWAKNHFIQPLHLTTRITLQFPFSTQRHLYLKLWTYNWDFVLAVFLFKNTDKLLYKHCLYKIKGGKYSIIYQDISRWSKFALQELWNKMKNHLVCSLCQTTLVVKHEEWAWAFSFIFNILILKCVPYPPTS